MTIRLRYLGHSDGEPRFGPVGRHDRQLCEQLTFGTVFEADEVKHRSPAHHRFWFAVVNDAWETLSEDLQARFPEPEALRKHLLIKAGWCDSREFVTDGPEAAAILASGLRWAEPYAAIVVRGNVVFVYVARSQKLTAQNRREFKAVTERGLHALAQMLGVDPTTLMERETAAA